MASIRKATYTKPIPADAKIVEKAGKQFARFKHKGRTIDAPLTKNGKKCSVETGEWYVRYKDADGNWQRRKGYTDKALTDELRLKIETEVAQEMDATANPIKAHKYRPLSEHIAAFRKHLEAKNNTPDHVGMVTRNVRAIIEGCGFKKVADISAAEVSEWLARARHGELVADSDREFPATATKYQAVADAFGVSLSAIHKWKEAGAPIEAGKPNDLAAIAEWRRRRGHGRGISLQTSNHYLKAIKQFTRWLVRDRRSTDNPLAYLATLRVDTDLRHQRRAICQEGFARLIDAAATGPPIEMIVGPDRAMLYTLAAWTGYRRGELASLTLRSFDFDARTPSVAVKAAYSKRRRKDRIPLHPVVVERLRAWLASRGDLTPDEPIFPLRSAGRHWRKTSKMMKRDLQAARVKWIDEASTDQDRTVRENSDFLTYQDEDGLFADFHANRHTFISNLGKAGVPLGMAQKLARHHDPKLTSNTYTHLDLDDQASAVDLLPAPPSTENEVPARGSETDESQGALPQPCHSLAKDPVFSRHNEAQQSTEEGVGGKVEEEPQVVKIKGLGTPRHAKSQVHPTGFEPVTFGSVDRRYNQQRALL